MFLELTPPLKPAEPSTSAPVDKKTDNLPLRDASTQTLEEADDRQTLARQWANMKVEVERLRSEDDRNKLTIDSLVTSNEFIMAANRDNKKDNQIEVEALQAQLNTERADKERLEELKYSDDLNLKAKEAEISSSRVEYGQLYRLKEKLNKELFTAKQNNVALQQEQRRNYPILTNYYLDKLRQYFEHSKEVAKTKQPGLPEINNENFLPQTQALADMTTNIRNGIPYLEQEIGKLRGETDDFLADFKVARFEAYIKQRREFMADVREAMDEIEDEINGDDEEEQEEGTVLYRI